MPPGAVSARAAVPRLTAARRGDFRADSDYDVPAVLSHHLGPKERVRLATRCRQRLEGLDVDVLVKSPDETRDYHDKRGSIVHEAFNSGIRL